jgi:ribulose-5-phosphate 4-epimerase/fuculose-1-phosphate aldolase
MNENLKDELAAAHRLMGAATKTFEPEAILSARSAEALLMTPLGKDRLFADDIVEIVDPADALIVADMGALLPSSYHLHRAIYAANRWIGCIMQVAMPHATTLATLANPTLEIVNHEALRFHNKVEYCSYVPVIDPAAARDIGRRIGDSLALVMQNRGVLIFGDSIEYAYNNVAAFEKAAHLQIRAMQCGRLSVISASDADRALSVPLEDHESRFEQVRRLYERAPVTHRIAGA